MRGLLIVLALFLSSGIVAAQFPYGAGTSGAGGFVPNLTCNQAWMGNTAFALQIDQGLGGASAFLGISLARDNFAAGNTDILISIAPLDLYLLVPLVLSGPNGTPGVGTASFSIPLSIPPVAGLAGFELYAQAVINDTTTGILSASRGLTVELTYPPSVFVGTSVGGAADPTWLVDPMTQTVSESFTSQTDNVTSAEFAHGGRYVYLGTSLGNQVVQVDRSTSPATRGPLYVAGGSCYGIGIDHANDLLYTLTPGFTGSNELVAVDIELGSPNYGLPQVSTTGIGGLAGFVERWSLSPSGRVAVAMTVFNPALIIINTDPNSPNYLSWTNAGPIPSGPGAGFVITPNVAITPTDDVAVIAIQQASGAAGEVARYDLVNGVWLDHNPATPGIQNIGPQSMPAINIPSSPGEIEISRDGSFAIVAGWAGTGGAARIDLDVANPFAWTATLLATGMLPGAWALSIEPDGSQFVASSFGGGVPPQLIYADTMTGAITGTTPLPGGSNIYTVTWR